MDSRRGCRLLTSGQETTQQRRRTVCILDRAALPSQTLRDGRERPDPVRRLALSLSTLSLSARAVFLPRFSVSLICSLLPTDRPCTQRGVQPGHSGVCTSVNSSQLTIEQTPGLYYACIATCGPLLGQCASQEETAAMNAPVEGTVSSFYR